MAKDFNKPAHDDGAASIESKFADYDRVAPKKAGPDIAIARVLVRSDAVKANAVGDRVSLDPQRAQWLAKQGIVIVEIAKVCPLEIDAVGGVDAYLAANPKKDKLDKQIRAKLAPIPGIPTETDKRKPWEWEVVED